MNDLDEIILCGKDCSEVLVCSRALIENALVLSALNPFSGPCMIFEGDYLMRLPTGHAPAGTMRTATEAIRIALPADDEGAGAHGAGNDTQIAHTSPHGTLAGHPDVLAEVVLALDVVVVAVDGGLAQKERRQDITQRLERQRHHLLAVLPREVLSPRHRFAVVVKEVGVLDQIGAVSIRQELGNVPPQHFLLGTVDEILADLVADTTATRMQHDPKLAALISTKLDEVVAGAEGAQMIGVVVGFGLRMLLDDFIPATLQSASPPVECRGRDI